MVQEKEELLEGATKALLHGQFQDASTLAEKGLLSLPKTTLALDAEKWCGKISLRQIDSSNRVETDCVGYCLIWLQACHETQISKILSRSSDDINVEGLDEAINFIPTYFKEHVCASMPFEVSIVWLKLVIAFQRFEDAKVEISEFLRSHDGCLYMQGHWEGTNSPYSKNSDDVFHSQNDFKVDARAKYEELVEILILHVLVPLDEIRVAQTFLDRDVALSNEKKLALYHGLMATIDSEKAVDQSSETADSPTEGNNTNTQNQLVSTSEKNTGLRGSVREELETEELSEEDLQTLMTAGGGLLLAVGFGILAYRRRRDVFEKIQFGLRNFIKLLR